MAERQTPPRATAEEDCLGATPIKRGGVATPSTVATAGSPAWREAAMPLVDLEALCDASDDAFEVPDGTVRVTERVPTWEAFCAVVPMFMGYACLFTLQHEVKVKYGIADDTSAASQLFGSYVSLLYIFNLIFRFAHNIVWGCVLPHGRVLICFVCMFASMTILGGCVFVLSSPWMGWVPLAYALGGTAVGTFEANMLSLLTPYGGGSKRWAVTAIPFGVTIITIGAFLVLEVGCPVHLIYFTVAVLCVFAGVLVAVKIPARKGSSISGAIRADLRAWRAWLPTIASLPPCMMLDMFGLSTFCPGVLLFVYDQPTVRMFGSEMSSRLFFAIYDGATFLGGAVGRYMSYRVKRRHPIWFTWLTVLGVSLLLIKSPEIAPLAGFFILLGDGCIYGHTCRNIDEKVPERYTLVATSLWLFVGDVGSVVGSNLIVYLRAWIAH